MIKKQIVCSVFVMNTETIDHGRAGLVQTNDLNICSLAPEFDNNFVERAYRRDVPKVRAADIDLDRIDHFLIIKCL